MAGVGQKYGIRGSQGAGWTFNGGWRPAAETMQTLAAAGATQGGAGAITGRVVIVTVTASTQGVRLPALTADDPYQRVEIHAAPTVGVLVYPATGDRIGAASTNAAVLLVLNKSNIYQGVNSTTWRVVKGA